MSLFNRFSIIGIAVCLLPALAVAQSFPDATPIAGPGQVYEDADFGDVDGDGDVDVVAVDTRSSSQEDVRVVLVRANASGYESPEELETFTTPARSVSFADLDGDGDLDIVTCSESSGAGSVRLRFNDGAGGFTAPVSASTEIFLAFSCATGDADGDGDVDIVIGDIFNSAQRPNVSVLFNDGSGSFPSRLALSDQTSASAIVQDIQFADVAGDALLEVVIVQAGSGNSQLAYYPNSSSGFGPISTISSTIVQPRRVVAADLDGNSEADLIVSDFNGSPVQTFINQGNGTFNSGPNLAIGSGELVFEIAAGDVDADGDIDVGAKVRSTNAKFRIDVYPNNGSASFAAPVTVASDVIVSANLSSTEKSPFGLPDLDLDGLADPFYGDFYGGLSRHLAQPSATGPSFADVSAVLASVPEAVRLIAADLDGDTDLDLVAAGIKTPRLVSWFENRGMAGFGPQQVIADRLTNNDVPLVVGLAAGDVNKDGLTDVLAGSNNDQVLALFTRTATGTFDPLQVVDTGQSFQGLEVVDIDGDTNPDILAAAGDIRWYPGQGTGAFGSPVTISNAVAFPTRALAADVDLDGDPDVVSFSLNDQKLAWYTNNGSGVFGAQTIISNSTAPAPADIALADLDSDGRLDIVALWGDNTNSVLEWYPNTLSGPTTVFGPANGIASGALFARPRAVKVIDIDDDGDLDVLTADSTTREIRLFRNQDGAGTFDSTGVAVKPDVTTFDVEALLQTADAAPELAWPDNIRNSVTVATNALERDFGDAPDPTFPTLRANDGARHIVSALFLGTSIDADADGQPNATATGDDIDSATNDEQGATLSNFSLDATQPQLDVVVSVPNAGRVNAWLDGNQDGDFNDPGEQIVTDELIENTSESIPFSLPSTTLAGDTILRVRLSSLGGDGVDGQAADGEVEDYQVTLAPPRVSINDAQLAEGDTGTATLSLSVVLSAPVSSPVTLDVSTADGTATSTGPNADYVGVTGSTVTIPANTASVQFNVTVQGDTTFEADETFTATLSNASGATIDRATATATITNDDPSPVVTLSQVGDPIDENGGVATVTATLANASDQPVTIDLAATGTASAADYALSATQIVIAAGDLSGAVTVTGVDDTDAEGNENLVLTISNVTGGAAGNPDSVTIEITDDELPTVELSQTGSPIAENGGQATLTATLSRVFNQPVTVDLAFSGSAVAADFSASATQIVIQSGALTSTATLTGTDDTIFEGTETVTATISAAQNAVIGAQDSASVDITDDDNAPTVSLGVSGSPIAENGGVATVTAILSNASTQAVTVDLTASGTASASDYSLSATQIVVGAGDLSGSVTVTGVDDTASEGDETVVLTIATVNGGTAGTPDTATVDITDDELPIVNLSQTGSPIAEDAGQATVTATLSRAFGQPVTVNLAYGGTASASDFAASASQIVIQSGAVTGSVTITGTDDTIFEGAETVIASISSATNATPGTSDNAAVDITDDDTAPVVSLSAAPLSIAEDGGVSTVTATLSNPSASSVTVQLATSGTATFADYSLSSAQIVIAAGDLTGTTTLTGIDDTSFELDETAVLTLDGVTGGTAGTADEVSITLTDDEAPPAVSLSASVATVAENGGTSDLVATLSFASPVDTTIPLQIAGGAGASDYSLSATQIVVPAGQTTASITLTGIDDTIDEPRELVLVRLGSLTNSQPGASRSVEVAITDDDPTPNGEQPRDQSSAVIDQTVPQGTQRIAVASFGLRNDAADDAQVESISVPLASLSGPAPAVDSVELYLDANGNGALDAGDGLVGSVGAVTNEAAVFALQSPLAIAAGATRRFLVILDLEPVAQAAAASTAE